MSFTVKMEDIHPNNNHILKNDILVVIKIKEIIMKKQTVL
jgi:hypothetical protein